MGGCRGLFLPLVYLATYRATVRVREPAGSRQTKQRL